MGVTNLLIAVLKTVKKVIFMAGSLLLANPRKRRRRSVSKKRVRRYRRNPMSVTGMVAKVQDAAIGGAGALAVDFAMNKMPFMSNMMTNPAMTAAAKGVVSLGIGMLVSKGLKQRKLGEQLAAGGMTVAMYEVGKSTFGGAIGLGYSGGDLLGYYADDFNTDFENEGMGYYGNANTFESDEVDEF